MDFIASLVSAVKEAEASSSKLVCQELSPRFRGARWSLELIDLPKSQYQGFVGLYWEESCIRRDLRRDFVRGLN